jgi:hypothetical protein
VYFFSSAKRNLLPKAHLLERIARSSSARNLQPVPALVGKQRFDPPRQVQVVPAALGLEALQLEVKAIDVEKATCRASGASHLARHRIATGTRPPDFMPESSDTS